MAVDDKRHPDPVKKIHSSGQNDTVTDGYHKAGYIRETVQQHWDYDTNGALKHVNTRTVNTPIKEKIRHTTFNFNSSRLNNFGNSELSFSENSSDMKAVLRANGIADRMEENAFNRFSRIPVIDPYNALLNTKEYIFITKPDLALFNVATGAVGCGLNNVPFFVDAAKRNRRAMEQLQSSLTTNGNPFMALLSNTVTSSLDVPGISAEMIETVPNIMGTKITYRGTSHKSNEEHDFNLEFEDNKYLDVYMLFKIYDEYERYKWESKVDFSESACGSTRWKNYIINKILHDQVTMYKFVVADDGQRLVYWARLTGCVPTSIPRDSFGDMSDPNTTKFTVGWKAHFVRDMDPIILQQFNTLVRSYGAYQYGGYQNLPIYDNENLMFNGKWAAFPMIIYNDVVQGNRGSQRYYYLNWYA